MKIKDVHNFQLPSFADDMKKLAMHKLEDPWNIPATEKPDVECEKVTAFEIQYQHMHNRISYRKECRTRHIF